MEKIRRHKGAPFFQESGRKRDKGPSGAPMVAAGASNDEIMIARGLAPDWDSQDL